MKKVIITGATGFIGGALAKRLLSEGVKVYGVGRNAERLDEPKRLGDFVPIVADFVQYDKLHEMIDERGFDMFWHFAWRGTSAKEYNDYNIQLDNIKAACAAATAAAALNCNRCDYGSSYQQSNVNIAKDLAFNPVLYGAVKRCAADLFKAIAYKNSTPCNNIIFPNTFGPGDKANTAIAFFIKELLAGRPLNLISGVHRDDWMFIDDLVDGIVHAAGAPKQYADYYIGHREITTFREKLLTMKSVLNSDSELNFGTYPETYYVDYSAFDLDALYNDTGFEAKTDFAESIRKTANWLKARSAQERLWGGGHPLEDFRPAYYRIPAVSWNLTASAKRGRRR
jgi:nucleoside-diphosphate-sugar epimerase